MKKISTIALAALLAGSTLGGYSALAQEGITSISNDKEQEQLQNTTNYMKATGVIQEIEKETDGIRVTIENEDKMITILRINDDSLLFNSTTTNQLKLADLKKGASVEAYYDKNKPMILIYPTTVTPEIVIVKDEKDFGTVKISQFDKDFLSLDGELKLNIGEETPLFNQQGKAIEMKDLQGKELLVFYSITTMSLPPQTPPTKVIALDNATEEVAPEGTGVEQIIANDHYMKNGVKMIPLRKVAEHLGYNVLSQPKVNGALVSLQNSSFTITRGEKMYGYNKSLRQFEVAPELKGMKTYVSEDFFELLIQN
ncbi:stalk domain-containing protein [Sporosarcina sp. YIM B06819]|uniref:stalk domain-containing protein n=1 Tax=Sporosarcina sp. YIM B06819 TaxID=3081769 RepID=UPI00298BD40F|nr:stalk domain-containing protein [Sporosarcina sp. YIM B06819]